MDYFFWGGDMGEVVQMMMYLIIGAAMGLLGGLFGIGGGLIAVPVLVLLLAFDQHVAQGTVLVMMVPTLMIGFWRYKQRNAIAWRSAITLAASAVCATLITAHIATRIQDATLHFAFTIFLLLLGVYYLATLIKQSQNTTLAPKFSSKYLFVMGVVMGATSGMFGVGGALVGVPFLVMYFGIKQTAAQGLGLVTMLPGALVALMTYDKAGFVHWGVGIPLAIGGLISVSRGVALAHYLPEKKLRISFGIGLVILALWMVVKECLSF
jgi:uncharacterized membrane protein YfcA